MYVSSSSPSSFNSHSTHSYRPYLSTQFLITYDAYLEICCRVNLQINSALGRNTPDWRLWNSCPPCFYKLEGEPSLEYSSFLSIDGNNSLRRVEASIHGFDARQDSRHILSDRWLTPEQVDKFKDEVVSRHVSTYISLFQATYHVFFCSQQKSPTPTIGRMLKTLHNQGHWSALTNGEMLDPKSVNRCLACLQNQGSLWPAAVTGLCSWYATWLKAGNCKWSWSHWYSYITELTNLWSVQSTDLLLSTN